MKARWQELSGKYAALKPREKWLVAGACAAVIGLGSHTLAVEPAVIKSRLLQGQIAQSRAEIASLQAQVAGLKSQLRDPDAPNKSALAETRGKLSELDQHLRRYDGTLVPPERVSQLLNSLLARHRGLELVSVQTLPPAPLITPKAEAKSDNKSAVPPAAETAGKGANIYKHGIEIKVAGSYADLLAYVMELERAPQKLLWGQMALAVQAHPRSELTLTVYTLSLDSIWLVV